MAIFEGTIKEFTKYVGAYTRLKVTYISSHYKKKKGACEDCGVISNSLDCAHIKGRERPVIISEILSEFVEGDIVKIDLEEFEQKFVEAHMPIEKTIRILCKVCHSRYDKRIRKSEMGDLGDAIEKRDITEGIIIEKLVKDQLMNKGKAISHINENSVHKLSNSSTLFSNLTIARNKWWFEPSNNKFQRDLYLIMNDDQVRKLYLFILPENTIKNPAEVFRQRNDHIRADCSDIYIPKSQVSFRDERGFDFGKHLVATFPY